MNNDTESSVLVRERYDRFLESVANKRHKLEDPGADRAELDAAAAELEQLYTSYVAGSSNARMIDMDAHALRNKVEIIETRTRNCILEEPGELTLEMMIGALRTRRQEIGSGQAVLDKIGQYFIRGSATAVLAPTLPRLGDINRRTVNRGARQDSDRPSGEAAHTQETVANDIVEQTSQKNRARIRAAIQKFQVDNPDCELELDRLVFDKYDHWHTLYNLHDVFVMIREKELWLGADAKGSPVIGIYKEGEPIEGHVLTERSSQFSRNLNAAKFAQLEAQYGKEEPLLMNPGSES